MTTKSGGVGNCTVASEDSSYKLVRKREGR